MTTRAGLVGAPALIFYGRAKELFVGCRDRVHQWTTGMMKQRLTLPVRSDLLPEDLCAWERHKVFGFPVLNARHHVIIVVMIYG